MKIDSNTVERIAHLARLEFDKEEKVAIREELDQIIAFVDKLNEIDTENIEPLIYMTDETDVLRNDVMIHEVSQEEALKNAPKKDSDYFKVSKVIEKEQAEY